MIHPRVGVWGHKWCEGVTRMRWAWGLNPILGIHMEACRLDFGLWYVHPIIQKDSCKDSDMDLTWWGRREQTWKVNPILNWRLARPKRPASWIWFMIHPSDWDFYDNQTTERQTTPMASEAVWYTEEEPCDLHTTQLCRVDEQKFRTFAPCCKQSVICPRGSEWDYRTSGDVRLGSHPNVSNVFP